MWPGKGKDLGLAVVVSKASFVVHGGVIGRE